MPTTHTPAEINPSILRALSLSPSQCTLKSHGGSAFATTLRLTTPNTSYFVKTSTTPGAKVMFQGEHASLNAIHDAVPSLCPKAFASGQLEGGGPNGGAFLVTEFLDLRASSGHTSGGSGMSLARKLATLHTTPVPEEFAGLGYGFPVSTCCGETVQENSWKDDWATFFAENRLMVVLGQAEANQGRDGGLRGVVERVCRVVVPRVLGEGLGGKEGIKPVCCHGDLWSGNKGRGVFVGRRGGDGDGDGGVEEVVFDPSAVYGHSEYDHGIMNMFGGFGKVFWDEYFELLPKTEPTEEYEDRVSLYEAYHHLNHYAMFGGGYKGGAVRLLQGLVKKYG